MAASSHASSQQPDKPPCRACVDFKSWLKSRRGGGEEDAPPPRGGGGAGAPETRQTIGSADTETAAGDHTLSATKSSGAGASAGTPAPSIAESLAAIDERLSDCPIDKDRLGRSTWAFLHTTAAYYADEPSRKQQRDMNQFIELFSQFYPCEPCAVDFREDIKKNPPNVKSRVALSLWMCQQHNVVNRKLGKSEFDCALVDERWKDGWKDGHCD